MKEIEYHMFKHTQRRLCSTRCARLDLVGYCRSQLSCPPSFLAIILGSQQHNRKIKQYEPRRSVPSRSPCKIRNGRPRACMSGQWTCLILKRKTSKRMIFMNLSYVHVINHTSICLNLRSHLHRTYAIASSKEKLDAKW